MSQDKAIVAAQTTSDGRGKRTYVLRTASGILVRVSPELYRQVTMQPGPKYLHMMLSTQPGSESDMVVVADVIELESRLERAKKEAAELAKRLSEIALGLT